jgi:hypothetical protein
VLAEVGEGMVEVVPCLPMLTLSWIAPEPHSHRDLQVLRVCHRSMPQLMGMQAKTSVCLMGAEVSTWCMGMTRGSNYKPWPRDRGLL